MWWLLAACGSCLLFSAIVSGTFVPLQNPDGVEYLFVSPPAAALLTSWPIIVAGLVTAFFGVRALARGGSSPHLVEADSGRWLAPIAALGVVVFGILPAVPGIGKHGAVVSYFLYDLRWWWAIVLVGLALARADKFIGAPLGQIARRIGAWSPVVRLLLLESLLFFGVVTWGVATTTHRFDTELAGDEPKYLRYCETWYQGKGFDISRLTLVRNQPLDAQPALLQNAVVAFRVIPQTIGALAGDLRAFVRNPSGFRWNRAFSAGGFVRGVHGGMYQIHEPGVCALLMPGYFIDRYLLNVDTGPDGRWPAKLTMTNLMMLLTYGVCAVLLFRLLRHALGSESLAWIWAATAMLTFPTTAFAFQFYPELPALLLILAVSNELLFGTRRGPFAAALAGAGAGALAFLHVRFLLICLCLTAVAVFTRRGGARWAFLGAFGCVMFTVMAFDYHVTGSWSPIARMSADGQAVTLIRLGFVLNFIGYGLDRFLGLLPHSLLLFGALPGLFVLARDSRAHAAFVAMIVVALVLPAAGYSLVPAGTTPDRFVAAVVPLLIWPVAVLVRRFWSSAIVRIVTVVLVVISLDSARAYNWNFRKSFGGLRDRSFSGWKPNLAFPIIRGEQWLAPANVALFLCLAALIVGVSWAAFTWAGRRAPAPPRPQARGSKLIPIAVVVALMCFFTVASSANDWAYPQYLRDDHTARIEAAGAVVSVDRCLCFTSVRGRIDWTTLGSNSARGMAVGMYPENLRLTVLVLVDGDGKAPAYGRMLVEFGDGDESSWAGILAERRVVHTYQRPGTYLVKVWFQLPTRLSPQLHQATVEVHAGG